MNAIQQRPNKLRRLMLNFGKLVLDATKLCFGSIVLGAAIRGAIPEETLLLYGIIASTSGAIFSLLVITFLEE